MSSLKILLLLLTSAFALFDEQMPTGRNPKMIDPSKLPPVAPLPRGTLDDSYVLARKTECTGSPITNPILCRGRNKTSSCICWYPFPKDPLGHYLHDTSKLCIEEYPDVASYKVPIYIHLRILLDPEIPTDYEEDNRVYKMLQEEANFAVTNTHILFKQCAMDAPNQMEYYIVYENDPVTARNAGAFYMLTYDHFSSFHNNFKKYKKVVVTLIEVLRDFLMRHWTLAYEHNWGKWSENATNNPHYRNVAFFASKKAGLLLCDNDGKVLYPPSKPNTWFRSTWFFLWYIFLGLFVFIVATGGIILYRDVVLKERRHDNISVSYIVSG